ncbi:MAG: aminopeptidase [Thermoplasmata archaeon]|nr:aminopeptidase [Thermoplasmata archaeon]
MTVPGFTAERGAQMARNVLRGSLRVRKGESVTIETWTDCLPWAAAFALEARRIGAHPLILYEDEAGYWEAVRTNPRSVGAAGAAEWAALAKSDAYVFFYGPADVPRFRALSDKAQNSATAYNPIWYTRAAKAKIRGARLSLGQVSEATARAAQVPLDLWREELIEGALQDPVKLQRESERLGRRLKSGRHVEISHPNGTRLKLRLRGREAYPGGGVVTPEMIRRGQNILNVPAGFVSVALDERVADGSFAATMPTPVIEAPATGGVWNFAGGKLTSFSYASGGDAIKDEYRKAPAGKERPGIITIGLNPALDIAPTLQDQARGTITVSVGANGFFGGSTKIPYSMYSCLRGGTLSLDGAVIVRDGRIV